MRRPTAAALAVLPAALALAACGGGSKPHGDLTMGDDSFSPSSLSVQAGATVTVANPSSMTHDVVVDGTRETPALSPGKTASFTAPTKPGSYKVTCDYHPDMLATLVVT